MTSDIFISYSSRDLKIAQTISAALEGRGFTCWYSERDILPGADFAASIVSALRAAKVMLFIFSENSNSSDEVLKEIALAGQYRMTVIPLRLEDITPNPALELQFATRQWVDFFLDWERAMEQLTARIASVTEHGGTSPTNDPDVNVSELVRPRIAPPLQTKSGVNACISRGDAYAKIGKYDLAITEYTEALRIDPTCAKALHNRGHAYQAQGALDLALIDFDEAIRVQPNYPSAFNNRGNIYLSKGDLKNAMADYDEAIRLAPDLAVAYNNRGYCCFTAYDYEGAINDFTTALRIKPDYAMALDNRAKAYDRTNQFELARQDRAALAALGTKPASQPKPPSTATGMPPWAIIAICVAGALIILACIGIVASESDTASPNEATSAEAMSETVSDATAETAPATDTNTAGAAPLVTDPGHTAQDTNNRKVNVVNDASQPIYVIKMAKAGIASEAWSKDLMGSQALISQDTIPVNFDDNTTTCEFDLLFTFKDGTTVGANNIDVCSTRELHVTANNVTTVAN